MAYCPLGRGFFSSGCKLVATLTEGDFRKVSEDHNPYGPQFFLYEHMFLSKIFAHYHTIAFIRHLLNSHLGVENNFVVLFVQYLPRLQPENLKHNQTVFERVSQMAARKGCTSSQLALAWVHHQGADVCPIPGTTKIENLESNIGALSVSLSAEEMAELEALVSSDAVKGDRDSFGLGTWQNSDTLPLSSWRA